MQCTDTTRRPSIRSTLTSWQSLKPIDGTSHNAQQARVDDLRDMASYAATNRTDTTPFDIVVEGETPGDYYDAARAIVEPWREPGATWWIDGDVAGTGHRTGCGCHQPASETGPAYLGNHRRKGASD